MAAIEVDSLRKEFEVPNGVEVAVDDVNLEIEEEEFLTLVGPSGCGKTTTLRCIAGLEIPTSGSIVFDGQDVTEVPANKRNLSMMFQNIALYPHMEIWENIAYPLKVRNVSKDERYEQAEEAASIMKVEELLEKYPGELSGGQRQRAALARTITQNPNAFLMDEPLSDLDAKLKVEIRKEIQRVHNHVAKPTIYVTHDQEEAMTMSDRIAVMNDSNIVQIGTPDDLYERPQTRFVAEFIGNPSMNFVQGSINEFDDETCEVDIGDRELNFDVAFVESELSGAGVSVGFRPEGVTTAESQTESDFQGEITLLERIGDRKLAYLQSLGGELRVTMPASTPLAEGETTSLRIDRDNLYVFDANSEELVARGTESQVVERTV